MKQYIFLFPCLLALCFCSCNDAVPDYGSAEAPVFRILSDTLLLSVGETAKLSLSVPLSEVEWASSADSVAVVDWRGVVTALSPGSAFITASRRSVDAADSLSSANSSASAALPVLMSDTCLVLIPAD